MAVTTASRGFDPSFSVRKERVEASREELLNCCCIATPGGEKHQPVPYENLPASSKAERPSRPKIARPFERLQCSVAPHMGGKMGGNAVTYGARVGLKMR
jgi:hypothetical protein